MIHVRQDISVEAAIGKYEELGCISWVAKFFGCSNDTIRNRLIEGGYKQFFCSPGRWKQMTQEERRKYLKWRQLLFERDGHRCRVCGDNRRIEPHHIKSWKKYPNLRFDIENGITLCYGCHKCIAKNEEKYEQVFYDILYLFGGIEKEITVEPVKVPQEKPCYTCGVVKRLGQYHKNKNRKDGRDNRCKQCTSEVYKNRDDAAKQRQKEQSIKWVENNKQRRKEYLTKYTFEKAIRENRIPKWNCKRAKLGLVTKNKEDWPDREMIEAARDKINTIRFSEIGI